MTEIDAMRHYQDNPEYFVADVLGEDISIDSVLRGEHEYATYPTDRQIEIMNSVRDYKYTAVPSANNQGKSHIAARVALWYCCCFYPSVVITTAPKEVQVKDILWARIRQAFTNSRTELGGDCYTLRYYPDRENDPNWFMEGMVAREAEGFSGFHEHHILFILDEASGISGHIYAGLEGMTSGANVRVLEISNPTTNEGDFAKHCRDGVYNVIHLDALEHPNVKYESEIYRGAVAPDWPEEMLQKWGEDSAMYQVRVRGRFPTDEEGAVIPLHFIDGAIDRVVKEDQPALCIGVDVARKGEAKTAICVVRGNEFYIDYTEARSNIADLADRLERDYGHLPMGIDDVGLGGGLVDILQSRGMVIYPYIANTIADGEEARRRSQHSQAGAREGEVSRRGQFKSVQEARSAVRFKDLQSESWWRAREHFEDGLNNGEDISAGVILKKNDYLQDLTYQLSSRKFGVDNDIVQVSPKSELSFTSDLADAFIIAHRTRRIILGRRTAVYDPSVRI